MERVEYSGKLNRKQRQIKKNVYRIVMLLLIHCLLLLPFFVICLCLVPVLLFSTLCPSNCAITLMNCLPAPMLLKIFMLNSAEH